MITDIITRHTRRTATILALAALVGSNLLQAQTWQTVLDYQLAPGHLSAGGALATDVAGDVFAGGHALDATSTDHGLVLKTDSASLNWLLSDDTNPTPSQDISHFSDLGFDMSGNLYSIGSLVPKCSNSSCPGSWLLRKSADRGASWSMASLYQYDAGMDSHGHAFAADSLGNIYTAGYGSSPAPKLSPGLLHWLVRKSPDGGQSWTLADDFFNSVKGGFPQWGIPLKAHFASGVGLFVVGQASSNQQGYPMIWTVRRSLDGSTTWSTVDLNAPGGSAYIACANGVGSDSQGNVYVVGRMDVSQVISHKTYITGQWIVRKSSDGGNTWSNIDVLTAGAGKIASAIAIGTDAAGKVVVAGQYQDAQSVYHWIVRRPDALGNWQTVDDFQLAPGYAANPAGVAVDAAGNLVVSGSADDGGGTHWLVRRTNP